MASTGNNGNSTGQSATSAQAAAAAGNAAASNAANSGTSNSSGNTSTNTSTGATNAAGLNVTSESDAQSAAQKGNAEKSNNKNKGPSQDYSKGYDYSDQKGISALINIADKISPKNSKHYTELSRSIIPSEIVAKADEAYTKARAEGKTEEEAQQAARNFFGANVNLGNLLNVISVLDFKGKNTGPTYDPSVTAQKNTNKTIAAGSSKMSPSTPAATTNSFTPAATTNSFTPVSAPSDNSTSETATPSVSESFSDASNTGLTYRGGTVSTPSGTSVTDSGTGGSISSSITPPSRDASSIGLGVYNNDRANYDQDNWNRGMESESSSLVSDEECKAFAKRAFMENSEPFKKVRITIIKKC